MGNAYASKSERLGVVEFGHRLLDTQDHDPVYAMLGNSRLGLHEYESKQQLKRWLLSYWLFYDVGVASFLSEKKEQDYWSWLFTAAANLGVSPAGGRWTRGSERRHFRGAAATACVQALRSTYPTPEGFVDMVSHEEYDNALSFFQVRERVKAHYLFGDWIAFKVADMLERLNIREVKFEEADVFMYSEPRAGALLAFNEKFATTPGGVSEDDAIRIITKSLGEEFNLKLAPPLFDRAVNIQEIETVLCKWKSHTKGHYWVGKDIEAILDSLSDWAFVGTASHLASSVPGRVLYGSE